MSDKKTLLVLIDNARSRLHDAMDAARKNPRPKNVCGSHDNLFDLGIASAEAQETVLAVMSQLVEQSGGIVGWVRLVRYPVAVIVSALIFSPQAAPIVHAVLAVFVNH
jgi:hypothetical protein